VDAALLPVLAQEVAHLVVGDAAGPGHKVTARVEL
jgi:hypothetical protein